uniref:pyridoxal 5'-phosphate synthase n=1 Tax=Oryza rufipogon TaxID=4529 RepID=A0A0E0NNS7_ORYRU
MEVAAAASVGRQCPLEALHLLPTRVFPLTDDLLGCLDICWYFTDTWEQFRISGFIDVIDGSNPEPVKLQLRERAWFGSSVKSRLQYLGPCPGLPIPDDDLIKDAHLDPSAGPVDAFCLLVLDPEKQSFDPAIVILYLGRLFELEKQSKLQICLWIYHGMLFSENANPSSHFLAGYELAELQLPVASERTNFHVQVFIFYKTREPFLKFPYKHLNLFRSTSTSLFRGNFWGTVMCTRVPDLPKGSDKQRFGRSRDTNRSGFLNAHALEPRNRSTTSIRVSDVRIKLHMLFVNRGRKKSQYSTNKSEINGQCK